ncbi:MAG: hypothetical protein AB7F64_01320 [Gammaproteobacteria bacterium]
MNDYAQKLAGLQAKTQQLANQIEKLEAKRLKEVGGLLKNFDLLDASQALLTGLFKAAQVALQTNPEQIKQWEEQGKRFQTSKSISNAIETNE